MVDVKQYEKKNVSYTDKQNQKNNCRFYFNIGKQSSMLTKKMYIQHFLQYEFVML